MLGQLRLADVLLLLAQQWLRIIHARLSGHKVLGLLKDLLALMLEDLDTQLSLLA